MKESLPGTSEAMVADDRKNITRERAALDRNRCAYESGPYPRGYGVKVGCDEVMARCLLDRDHAEPGHLIETPGGNRSRVWPEPEEESL